MIDKSVFIDGVADRNPEELLDGRLTVEGNLLACLFNDPTIYDDIKQQVDTDSFVTRDGQFLFNIVKYLREKRFNKIDEVTVLSNCTEHVKDRLVGIGGWKMIQKMTSVVDMKNWEGIYDAFNKSNVLLRLHANGFNLFNEITLNNGKKIKPFDMFSRPAYDSQSVIAWYEEFISKISVENSSSSTKVIDEEVVTFDDTFIDGLTSGEAAGVSFADASLTDVISGKDIRVDMFPFLSRNVLGLAPGTTSAIAAHSGVGKSTLMINVLFSLMAKGRKGLLISNEMSMKDIKTIIILIILTRYLNYWNITKQKLKTGNLSTEEIAKIHEANAFWNANFKDRLKIITMSDNDSELTEQEIKRAALRDGIDFFVVDTFKLNLSDGSSDNAFWIDLVKDSRMLDSLAKKYNLIGLYTIQLAQNSIGQLFLDASALSMSKAIKEVLSNLIMVRKTYPDEFAPGSPYDCKPFRSVECDGVWHDEEYSLEDPDAVYRCVTIDKCRSNSDSGDTGICYLFKYKGDWAKFSETCKCRPVHKNIKAALSK